MNIVFTEEFNRNLLKIKDQMVMLRVVKLLRRLEQRPDMGKPLRHDLKGQRSLRIHPFRIIYKIEQENIYILTLEHRKDVYE